MYKGLFSRIKRKKLMSYSKKCSFSLSRITKQGKSAVGPSDTGGTDRILEETQCNIVGPLETDWIIGIGWLFYSSRPTTWMHAVKTLQMQLLRINKRYTSKSKITEFCLFVWENKRINCKQACSLNMYFKEPSEGAIISLPKAQFIIIIHY